MGRNAKPRGIDVANMIAGYQTMIADTRSAIEHDDKHPTRTSKDLLTVRMQRIKHYEQMISRLMASGALARPKQHGSRLILCTCECGYKLRTTMNWITIAVPRCPQKKVRQPEVHTGRHGGYTIGCTRGGQPMEFEVSSATQEDIEQFSGAEGREKMKSIDEQALKDSAAELEQYFGAEAMAFDWGPNDKKTEKSK